MDIFKPFGDSCEVRACEGFAFAEYETQREADDAMATLTPQLAKNGGALGGVKMTLAWGKRSIIAKYEEEVAERKRKEAARRERKERRKRRRSGGGGSR